MARVKPSPQQLAEAADQAVKQLEGQIQEYHQQIEFLAAKIDDAERKVRWIKRELIE